MGHNRLHLFDNAKFALILLVVLGHTMEVAGDQSSAFYRLIYLFHMPAFVCIAGYFSKQFRPAQLFTLLWQYALFQALYCLFAKFVLGQKITLAWALTTPYWIMWFLFSLLCWKLLALLARRARPPLMLAGAVLLSLLSDLAPAIDYDFSLSRTLAFFPFFLAGLYLQNEGLHRLRRIPRWLAAGVFAVSFLALAAFRFPHVLLYGTLPYERLHLSPLAGASFFLLLYAWGGLLVACFLALVPARELPVSRMGARSLQCYLLHGFVLRALAYAGARGNIIDTPAQQAILYALCLPLALVLLSAPVEKLLRPVLQPGCWLAKLRRPARQPV